VAPTPASYAAQTVEDQTAAAEFEPDVGVLIVHGIGTQKEGSELRQWVDAVLQYLDACPPAVDSKSDPRILQSSPGDKFVRLHTPPLGGTGTEARQRWLIGEAWWADAFDVPDRKEVSRWMVGVSTWFLFLFVVRLWRRFYVDALHIIAGCLIGFSVGWFFRDATTRGVGLGSRGLIASAVVAVVAALVSLGRPGKRLGGLVVGATLVIGYPLAALVTAAAFLLWLIGLLPGKISEKARAMQLGLAQSVGDVYALIASRRREQAMFDAISGAAKRLADAPGMATKPLVVLAHSQGAALTYRALNTDAGLRRVLANRKVTVITYGGAVVPVHVLEQRLRGKSPALRRFLGFAGWAGLLLFAFSLVRLGADGFDGVARWATRISLALVTVSVVVTRWEEVRSRCDPDIATVDPSSGAGGAGSGREPGKVCIRLRAPEGDKLRWVDLWAPWDPVPNGPLCVPERSAESREVPPTLEPPTDGNEFLSCRVANVHQPWRDHVVYRENHEDVVSRWVGEIAVRAKPAVKPASVERPGRPGKPAETGRKWRLRRGKYLLIGQVVTLIIGVVSIAVHWAKLDDLGRRVARSIPLRSALSSAGDVVPEGARDVLFGQSRDASHLHGLLAALAVLLGVILIGTKIVSAWQKAGTRAYLAGAQDAKLLRPVWMGASIVGGLLVVLFPATAALFPVDEVPTRTVRVISAVIDKPPPATRSAKTTVRFEPVGTGDDEPVVVKVGEKAAEAELDAGVEYLITATATGGKDCTVSVVPAGGRDDLTVTCAAAGTLLPRVPR
jgi:hypothetical protein